MQKPRSRFWHFGYPWGSTAQAGIMAQSAVDLSNLPAIENPGRIEILISKWYPELTNSLAETCARVLRNHGFSDVRIHTLPGSLELPLAAADLLSTDTAEEIDAVVCFGVILKGETLHFEMITNECMRGLGEVMRQYRRPVIVEILPVLEMAHAEARAGDDEFNKGFEAAAAAIEMIAWRRSVLI